MWILFVVSSICGSIVGYLCTKLEKIGFILIGGLGGVMVGMFLYTAFLHYISNSKLLLYIIAGILAVIGGVLGMMIQRLFYFK